VKPKHYIDGFIAYQTAYVFTSGEEKVAMCMMAMSNEDKMSDEDKAPSKRDGCET
jgi:hypothetical protein